MANDIIRWDPFDELRQMRQLMNRLVPFAPVRRDEVEFGGLDEALPVDIYEKDNAVVVKTALPGVDPNDIDVNVTDGVLHIRAETKAEQDVSDADYHRREYRYGRFSRSFRLPPNLDASKATAEYQHGMLRLTFPRLDQDKSRSIKLQVQPGQTQGQIGMSQGQGQGQIGMGQGQGQVGQSEQTQGKSRGKSGQTNQ